MRRMGAIVLAGVLLGGMSAGVAQSRTHGGEGTTMTRYFELTMVLRFPGAPGREERVQRLTTDLAVVRDRPGASSGKARMISQTPVMMQKGPTYVDLGTKLDCNDVRVDGNALAMGVVLETSAVNGTVTTVDKEGRSLQEPLISQRNLSLQIRLPFGKPTVIFDAKNGDLERERPLPGEGGGASATVEGPPPATEMQVEMTARELP